MRHAWYPAAFGILLFSWLFSASCMQQNAEIGSDSSAYDNGQSSDAFEETSGDDFTPIEKEGENQLEEDILDTSLSCSSDSSARYGLYAEKPDAIFGPPLARAMILSGEWVDFPIRLSEFLNYYHMTSKPSPSAVQIGLDMAARDNSAYDLFVSLSAAPLSSEQSARVNLTLSIDASESTGEDSLALIKAICQIVYGRLSSRDTLSITTWDENSIVLVESLHGDDDASKTALDDALAGMVTGGATDIGVGIQTALATNADNASIDSLNRVLIISDGRAEIGITTKDIIEDRAALTAPFPVRMIAVGVSGDPTAYHLSTMKVLSEAGRGPHLFIDTIPEAEKVLGGYFSSLVCEGAMDVSVALTLPPGMTLAGTPLTTSEDSSGADLTWEIAFGMGMMFVHRVSSCDGDALDGSREVRVDAEYSVPSTGEIGTADAAFTLDALIAQETDAEIKTRAVVAYVETLGALRTLSGDKARTRIDETSVVVKDSLNQLTSDDDLEEIVSLLDAYRQLF